MNKKIKILLVDDHPLVRLGLREELKRHSDFLVIGEAANGSSAVKKCRSLNPDVVLLDLGLPDISGMEITPALKKNSKVKIIAVSMHDNISYIEEMTNLGADGYVMKDSPPGELRKAIYEVMEGKKYYCKGSLSILKNQTMKRFKERNAEILTTREKQILLNIAGGKTNKQIADNLFLSVRTVEAHRDKIKSKLNLKNTAELTKYALLKDLEVF
jgi:DNA-binding NarL/FixJ family response regulator